jgi:2'-5' RNA ligase
MHLTLRFLGEINPDIVPDIDRVLETAAGEVSRFRLRLSGLGAFPNMSRPRVIWVGVGGDLELLGRLKKGIDRGLKPLGFPPEDRPFKPHITLGRVKTRIDGRALIGSKKFSSEEFFIWNVRLIQSTLKPQGAEYNEILSRPFAAGD